MSRFSEPLNKIKGFASSFYQNAKALEGKAISREIATTAGVGSAKGWRRAGLFAAGGAAVGVGKGMWDGDDARGLISSGVQGAAVGGLGYMGYNAGKRGLSMGMRGIETSMKSVTNRGLRPGWEKAEAVAKAMRNADLDAMNFGSNYRPPITRGGFGGRR